MTHRSSSIGLFLRWCLWWPRLQWVKRGDGSTVQVSHVGGRWSVSEPSITCCLARGASRLWNWRGLILEFEPTHSSIGYGHPRHLCFFKWFYLKGKSTATNTYINIHVHTDTQRCEWVRESFHHLVLSLNANSGQGCIKSEQNQQSGILGLPHGW